MTEPTEGEGTAIWDRLRRRKVVQWGIAYAAGAWGFLQGLAYVSTLLNWPAQLQKLTGLALLIGLPIVLVLAWFHGERGHRRVTRSELAILTLLFLAGGGLFWWYQHTSGTASIATAPTSIVPAADAGPSIAVLPFENRSSKSDDAFFVDGIHDDILTQLSKISALKVISRTSVEQFRDTKLTMKEIGEKLGVTQVVEGGVQRAGDRVRVTVQLIDTATDGHLWAENYDRELTAANIFAIQSEVAAAIAGALKATLTAGEKARVNAVPTQNLEAWEAYQLGKQRMAKRTTAGLRDAATFFHKAISLDPNFALAYAGLANTLLLELDYDNAPGDATLEAAETAIDKAFELDPDLADAWVSSANIAQHRKQYGRAEQAFRRAIELNPNNATAYHWFSGLLAERGRIDESLTNAQKAVDLDPLSAIINLWFSLSLQYAGRFDEADARIRRAIEIDPSMPSPYRQLGLLRAYSMNRVAEAVPLLAKAAELDPDSSSYPCFQASFNLELDNVTEAARIIEAAMRRWPDDTCLLSMSTSVHLYRGDQKAALRDARRLLELDPADLTALAVLRDADLQAGHPQLALARYATGYPDLFASESASLNIANWFVVLDLALALQNAGDNNRAGLYLDQIAELISTIPRLGIAGYGIADVQILALRGQKREALAALREAEKAGWRADWRYHRDSDPALASIRNDLEFKAVFADIERDMARQRAELAKRPKDAPLDIKDVRK